MNDLDQTNLLSTKRPLALTVLALVVFGWSLVALVNGVIAERGFNPASQFFPLLNLFAAIGLLKLRSGWRKYLLVVMAYWLAMLCLFGPWALVYAERVVVRFPAILVEDRPHELETRLTVLVALGLNGLALGWAIWVLRRRDVKGLFYQSRTNHI